MNEQLLKLYQTMQEIDAAGKVKLSFDERATIERETADLIRKSQMNKYKFAAKVPEGLDKLLKDLEDVDAEEAYKLIKSFMDKEDKSKGDKEPKEDKDKDNKDNKEPKEPKEPKGDKNIKDFEDDEGDFEEAFGELSARLIAQLKEVGKPKEDGTGPEGGGGPGSGGKSKDPDGKGRGRSLKDLKDKEKKETKRPNKDEMGVEDIDLDPSTVNRAAKVRVKVTKERNIIAYHLDHGPIFRATPSKRVRANADALRRLANKVYGLAVYQGFGVAARACNAKMLRTFGVDDDVDVVTREEPNTPATQGVEPGAEGLDDQGRSTKSTGVEDGKETDIDESTAKLDPVRARILRKLRAKRRRAALAKKRSVAKRRRPVAKRRRPVARLRRAQEGVVPEGSVVTETKPGMPSNRVTEGEDDLIDGAKLSTPDSIIRDEAVNFKAAKRLEAAYKRLYASRLKQANAEFIKKFSRCLRISSQRMLLNHDEHPMKVAIVDVLTGGDIELSDGSLFRPMASDIAVDLTELISTDGHSAFVTHLMKSANSLMGKSAEYLKDAESDLESLKPVAVEVEVEVPVRAPKKSMRLRKAAANFGKSRVVAKPVNSSIKSNELREYVSGNTKVGRALGNLTK